MGTITVNVDADTEQMFRKTVKETTGVGKGKLGKAITEAMKKWVDGKRQKEIAERQIRLLEKGFDMGGFKYKNRDELHERSI